MGKTQKLSEACLSADKAEKLKNSRTQEYKNSKTRKLKNSKTQKLQSWLCLLQRRQALVYFILIWAWAALWWGDVLWVAHERSFFAADSELMEHVLSQSFGVLHAIGRALLSLCYQPWLGGAVFAMLLTGIMCCLKYAFVRRGSRKRLDACIELLCYIVPLLWVMWLTFMGFDAYFKGEPGRIFGIPLLVLIVLMLQAFFVWTFRHRRKPVVRVPSAGKPYALLVTVVLLAATMVFEVSCRPWVRPTAKMERLYDAQDWTGIRDVATSNATVSCRPMAAYYAIALVKQDELMRHLFDIRFEYDDIYMHDYNGDLMNNTPYYIVECDMHAGLLQFAYHKAIEDLTMDGPTIHNLKALVQITAMRHEDKVCRKYLNILDRTIGTSDFTALWRNYLTDNRQMEADPWVATIRRLEPIHDGFESAYTDPAFLGYNLMLQEGQSSQALVNSIAVCLYTKLVPPFLERAQYLTAEAIMNNTIIADALAMQINRNPDILRALPNLSFNKRNYESYVARMRRVGAVGNTEERMPYAEEMWEGSQGYYPYYYYFGNLRATRSDAAAHYGYGRNDGVN